MLTLLRVTAENAPGVAVTVGSFVTFYFNFIQNVFIVLTIFLDKHTSGSLWLHH